MGLVVNVSETKTLDFVILGSVIKTDERERQAQI